MRRILPIAVTTIVLLAGLVSAGEDAPLQQALESFKKGKYRTTVELTAKVPADATDYAKARYLAGEAHLKLRESKKADSAFRDVLALRPKAVPAMVGLGRAREAQDDLEEAEKLYRAAIKEDGRNAAARRALGELQVRQEKLGKARATLRSAYKLAPTDALCARALVEVLLRGGDAKGAEKIAKSLIKARPEHPMGYFLRALLMERGKKIGKATELYKKALALDEHFLDAHKNLAILLHTNNPEYKDRQMLRDTLDHYEAYFMAGGRDKELRNIWRQLKRFVDTEFDLDDDEDEEDDDD